MNNHVKRFDGDHKRGGSFHISPHRFQPRSSAMKRRRDIFKIVALIGTLLLVCIIGFPRLKRSKFWASDEPVFTYRTDESLGSNVRVVDLASSQGTARGWERGERVLMCVPLRDAAAHLPMFFSHLNNLTYPHNLIDLSFLVSDSKDDTMHLLKTLLDTAQAHPDPLQRFGDLNIFEKDFGQAIGQGFSDRHGFAAQGPRRKLMARARNWLLSAALRPEHSWVYWRDVDVEVAPPTLLEDLMRHNKDVIVPNVWRPLPDWLGGEQPYDLNSWQESETALQLADTLEEDAVIVEGYAEYATWRPHLAYLRDPYGDPDVEMEIDGIGGVSILAKANVFRNGAHFPAFSFEKHAETEGFGKMCKRMQYAVIGLPHYVIWHLYEPSQDDLKHMARMEEERLSREAEEAAKVAQDERMDAMWRDPTAQWEKDKLNLMKDSMIGSEQGPVAHVGEEEAQVANGKAIKHASSNNPEEATDEPGFEANANGLTKTDEDGEESDMSVVEKRDAVAVQH